MVSLTSEIDPIEITNLGELVSYATDLCLSDNEIRWFRGHAEAQWAVQPSLWRDYNNDQERNFTNRFRSRAALRLPTAPSHNNYPAWLSLMQHYGLPTRLLDWSRSPLIAAYFAVSRYLTKDTTPADAVIWVLRPHYLNSLELNTDLTFPIDADTAREMLEPAFRKRPENGKVLAVMAVEHDMRMFVQQGAFTIHSEPGGLNKREGHSRYLIPLLVKADSVGRMAAELHCSGFRRGDIYPDLTNLADELKGLS